MKNRPINSTGSVVLITLIVMTAFVIIVHSTHRASSYLLLLAQERELFEQNYQKIAL